MPIYLVLQCVLHEFKLQQQTQSPLPASWGGADATEQLEFSYWDCPLHRGFSELWQRFLRKLIRIAKSPLGCYDVCVYQRVRERYKCEHVSDGCTVCGLFAGMCVCVCVCLRVWEVQFDDHGHLVNTLQCSDLIQQHNWPLSPRVIYLIHFFFSLFKLMH